MTSKLTREQLHERARENVKALKMASRQHAFESAREEILADLQLAKLALAAMDCEPVAWMAIYHGEIYDDAIGITRSVVEAQADRFGWESALTEIIPLYPHAQPAPVVQMVPEEPPEHLMPKGNTVDATYRRGAAIQAWKQCRAAMLQTGNSPVIPDGLIPAAQKLLERYLANPGTHSEFIACWTPSKSSIGTGGVWDEWKALESALTAAPKDEAKKDKPHNNFGTGARLTNHRFKV
ncbi:TPA: hypothetical protein PJH99_004122 [Raoultella ornithinolytica]|nr:hypothetical protein [Raoultella ornithinolytica]HDG9799368.1 hypothetical protein [Raoultella ornithinolytica]HDG9800391.1 hypothetical protein [Raoultella ornithinolytica]HDG9835210.1 hypothetical protein [Raoultella ornithinolytica]HDH7811635.1 hypothetical protein [Raoultella ornithinolytica]